LPHLRGGWYDPSFGEPRRDRRAGGAREAGVKKREVDQVRTLFETLPYIKKFAGTTVVIKFGGKAMVSPELKSLFAEDIVFLKYLGINPVVVHGGGPQIGAMMERMGLVPSFVDGHRVTDADTMAIVEMVLAGSINKGIVADIQRAGGKAVGLSGKDGFLLQARRKKLRRAAAAAGDAEELVDIGLVGEIVAVDPDVVRALEEWDFIPVISPIGVGADGQTYNINADTAAAAVAASLQAQKLVYLTDSEGVLDKDGALIATLDGPTSQRLIRQGVIREGMIPKVGYCLSALEGGVKQTHIIDGRHEHAILLELFTERGIGTEILAG
jgi:acetylglutamate kinase